MTNKLIEESAFHAIPDDLMGILTQHPAILVKWNSLTPIARNEWICWITIVKKPTTRVEHLKRFGEDLLAGKKRPCCWPGCPHRKPNAKKWFKNLPEK